MKNMTTLLGAPRKSKRPALKQIKGGLWRKKNQITEKENRKSSYREKLMGMEDVAQVEEEDLDLGDVFDDDVLEEDDDGPWFSMGMTKKEKCEAKKVLENESNHQTHWQNHWLESLATSSKITNNVVKLASLHANRPQQRLLHCQIHK